MARGSAGESVLHKHLRVLRVVRPVRPFLTLGEIADAAGLAPSTAHRLVAELEREGLLERMPDRSYRLGVRLWEFASRTPGALGLRELARPWLGAVHARVRQHTQLGVLAGLDVLFIERMSTRDAVVNATLIGGRIPLPISSSGLVLLAHAGDALVDAVVDAGWPPARPSTRSAAATRCGSASGACAPTASRSPTGTSTPSRAESRCPVLGPHGVVYAAMGVVVPNDDTSPQAAIELLTVAAAGITRALEEAYLPSGERPGIPLMTTSVRSLEYFAVDRRRDDPAARRGGPRRRGPVRAV